LERELVDGVIADRHSDDAGFGVHSLPALLSTCRYVPHTRQDRQLKLACRCIFIAQRRIQEFPRKDQRKTQRETGETTNHDHPFTIWTEWSYGQVCWIDNFECLVINIRIDSPCQIGTKFLAGQQLIALICYLPLPLESR